MKRLSLLTILLLVAATLLRADVKTTEKVVTKFGVVPVVPVVPVVN